MGDDLNELAELDGGFNENGGGFQQNGSDILDDDTNGNNSRRGTL